MPRLPVFRFTRMRVIDAPQVLVGGEYPIALAFRLSDLPASTEFTALFDQWRICAIDISVMVGNGAQHLYACADYNDDSAPSSSSLLERGETEVTSFTIGSFVNYRRRLVPKVSVEMFRSALSTGYGILPGKQWIDCSTPDVAHYGWKAVFIPNLSNGVMTNTKIVLKYHLEFRGSK